MKRIVAVMLLLGIAFLLFSVAEKNPVVWRQNCVGCGECVAFCPANAIRLEAGKAIIDTSVCIDCKFCVTTCRYKAVR